MTQLHLVSASSAERPTVAKLCRYATCDIETAGAFLGIGRGAAYRAAARGEIPTLRLGSRLLVPVPKLLALVGAAIADP